EPRYPAAAIFFRLLHLSVIHSPWLEWPGGGVVRCCMAPMSGAFPREAPKKSTARLASRPAAPTAGELAGKRNQPAESWPGPMLPVLKKCGLAMTSPRPAAADKGRFDHKLF